MLQGTKPQSLAYAMVDNPVAQAAWLVSGSTTGPTCATPFDDVFSREDLLTAVMIYVMNDAFIPSTWYLRRRGGREGALRAGRHACDRADGVHGLSRPAFAAAAALRRRARLQCHALDRPAAGGHFAAMEVPDLFVEDLRAWGREID